MSKATEEALSDLHGAVAEELTRRIAKNEASAADIGAAIKFLKDNSITASVQDNSRMKGLQDRLKERAERRRARNGGAEDHIPDAALTDTEAAAIVDGTKTLQ